MARCRSTTKKGKQCKLNALPGSQYCVLHHSGCVVSLVTFLASIGTVLTIIGYWDVLCNRGLLPKVLCQTPPSVLIFLDNSDATKALTPMPPALIINSPPNDSLVESQISVSGVINVDLCATCKLYSVVRSVGSGNTQWYVQSGTAIIESDKQFFLETVNIGTNTSADKCKQFEIWTVISSPNLRIGQWSDAQWERVKKIASAMVTVKRKC